MRARIWQVQLISRFSISFIRILIFVLTFCSEASRVSLYAAPGVSYDVRLHLGEEQLALTADAKVELRLEAEDLAVGSCLYVPQQDPIVEKTIAQLAIRKPVVQDQASRQVGGLTWDEGQGLESLGAGVYRISRVSEPKTFTLHYALRLSGWKDRDANTRIVTQFYPQLLPRCPVEGSEANALSPRVSRFSVALEKVPGWSVLAPGRVDDGTGRYIYEGRSLSLVLYRQGRVDETRSESGRLLTLSNSNYFQELRQHAEAALKIFENLTAWRPEKDFLLIETEDYEPFRIPGLIVLNRPQQAGMRLIQEDYLHWSVWQLAQAIADQWFGIGIRTASFEDLWLAQGFADYLVMQFLDSERLLSNLFVGDEGEEAYLRLGYRQAQDLMASYLSISVPHNALVDAQLKSRPVQTERSSYAFVRHTQGLRYLQRLLSDPVLSNWLRAVAQKFRDEPLRPQTVFVSLEQNLPTDHLQAAGDLRAYWESDSWPEMAIGEVTSDGGGSLIEIRHQSSLRVAFDVTVKSRDGRRFQHEMNFKEESSRLAVPLRPGEIASIEINADRSIYDSDRYNNRSGWPSLVLFPGDARTLADDAYTVIWLPLASKLPGQKFSLQLGWQVMRYVGSGMSGFFRYEPETGVRGFSLSYRLEIPRFAARIGFGLAESDGRVLPGERLWDMTLTRIPLISRWPLIGGSARARMRQMLGQPEKNHMTTAVRLSRKFSQTDACGIDIEGEHEMSAWVPNGEFSYARTYGITSAACDTPHLRAKIRAFTGASRTQGLVPGGALFQAQSGDEANIRLDRAGLPLAQRVQALNLDLATPARLPLPDSAFVLPRRSLFKVYSDWGVLHDPNQKVQAAGLGLLLPFGGDIAGRSSVTLLQFSLYSVLYRRIENEIDRKPGFIFAFGGDL